MSSRPVCCECGTYVCCGKTFTTAYGELLCPDCYDDYLFTDEGKVEYVIGIVSGDYPMDCFDADFLGEIGVQWNKHKKHLVLDHNIIADIEKRARIIGLLS